MTRQEYRNKREELLDQLYELEKEFRELPLAQPSDGDDPPPDAPPDPL